MVLIIRKSCLCKQTLLFQRYWLRSLQIKYFFWKTESWFEQNRAISLVGDILDDWQNRTPTMLDESIIDEVYDLACSEPKSCQELADEVYAILEENYPELIDASTNVNALFA